MKLLVITQKVDSADPILGFFHRWLEVFSEKCSSLVVIGQNVGRHSLPKKTRVVSMGKERGCTRIRQILRMWYFAWKARRSYDAVLVHMTPIWIVLGAPLWMLLGKKMYLWYEAQGGGWPLRVSLFLIQKVFSASHHGLPVPSKKHVVTGHGIDTNRFVEDSSVERDPHLVITVGRTTKAKRFDVVIRTFAELDASYSLLFGGGPITEEDKHTLMHLEEIVFENEMMDRVTRKTLSQDEVIASLQKASLFLHASDTALDKVVLEAMACGCPVVSCAEAVHEVLPLSCIAHEDQMLETAVRILELSSEDRQALQKEVRSHIEEGHSLDSLIDRLVQEMS